MCGPCVCYRFSHTCWWSGNSGQGRCHLLQAHHWGPDYWVGVPDWVWGLVMSKPGRLHGNRGQCQGAVTEAEFLRLDWGVNSGAVDALTLDTGQHHWGGGDESLGVSALSSLTEASTCGLCADHTPATMPRWLHTPRKLSLSQHPEIFFFFFHVS